MAGNSTFDQWFSRTYIRYALNGHTLWTSFFSRQIGGFLGVWLGGRMYDIYGNYEAVWWVGIAIGAFSALIHLPIKERSITLAT